MKRCFINSYGIDIHVRICGRGFPLVLLHASPSSSKMFASLAELLQGHFTLIMPDTPGYGLSDSLPKDPTDLSDYIPFLKGIFDHLGLKRFAIYGSATGAQLAIRYGLGHPDAIEHLFLDNAAHFTEDQYLQIKDHYFPDLTPQYDGSHLPRMWTVIKDMFRFFPWYDQSPSNRLKIPPLPASIYHSVVMDFLQAGAGYSQAYAAAFKHERAEHVLALQQDVTVFRHQASIVLPYIDQLAERIGSRENIQVIETPASPSDRYEKMRQHMLVYLPTTQFQLPKLDPSKNSGQFFVDINGRHIHGRLQKEGTGQAIAVLPNPGESAAIWGDHLPIILKGRPGACISLSGQGESDIIQAEAPLVIQTVMKQVGFDSFETYTPDRILPQIQLLEPDHYGMYLQKAWIDLREAIGNSSDTSFLHLALKETLKYRAR